jgi:hypothetical protein
MHSIHVVRGLNIIIPCLHDDVGQAETRVRQGRGIDHKGFGDGDIRWPSLEAPS